MSLVIPSLPNAATLKKQRETRASYVATSMCAGDASMVHQRESLTAAGVEADRRDSLLFHFISFFSLFFNVFCSNSPDGWRGCPRQRWQRERERKEGLLLGPQQRRRGARCGREKSFNVKVTWAHAHRIDHTQKRDRAEAAKRKGNGVEGGEEEGRGYGRTR